jgi:RNA polymerase sigma factor (sigma-70 family)
MTSMGARQLKGAPSDCSPLGVAVCPSESEHETTTAHDSETASKLLTIKDVVGPRITIRVDTPLPRPRSARFGTSICSGLLGRPRWSRVSSVDISVGCCRATMVVVASTVQMTYAAQAPGCMQDTLWREHADRLVKFATFLVGPSDANDVVVEAFLRAAPRLLAGNIENPDAYLYRAVTNHANDLRRTRSRRWRRDLHAIGPAHAAVRDDFSHVRSAVAELSVAQRTVVYLVYWEDRTERDIASLLDVSPSTVRQHLVRARTHLRKALE